MHMPLGAPPRAAGASARRVLANNPPTQVIIKASLSVGIALSAQCLLQVADAVSPESAEACEENVHRMDGAVQVMLILLAGNQLILVAMLQESTDPLPKMDTTALGPQR